MNINWNENPLKSTVEVDRSDRERILLYIQNEYYSDLLCHLDLWLRGDIQKDDEPTIEKILEQISTWGRVCNMETDDQEVEENTWKICNLNTPGTVLVCQWVVLNVALKRQ